MLKIDSKVFDAVRIDAAENGFVIYARKCGTKPQSYAYTDKFVAVTWADVIEVLKLLKVAC